MSTDPKTELESTFSPEFAKFKKELDKCEDILNFKINESIEFNQDELVTKHCTKYYQKKLCDYMNESFFISANISNLKIEDVNYEYFLLKQNENQQLMNNFLSTDIINKRMLSPDSRLKYFFITDHDVKIQKIFKIRRYVYLNYKDKISTVNILSDQSNFGWHDGDARTKALPFDVADVKQYAPANGFTKPDGTKFDFTKDFMFQKIYQINTHTKEEYLQQNNK
jgi:hypothetical protein